MRRTTLFFAAAAMILSFATASAQQRSLGANIFALDDANPGVTPATLSNTAWLSNVTGRGSFLITTGAVPGSEATPSANTLLDLWTPDVALTGKALLLTRLSAANIVSITAPVAGMIVYDKTNSTIDININGTAAGWIAASPSPSGTSANEGIVYNNTSGTFQYRLGASGGAAATTNPFLANRSINLDAFNLNFTSNGGVLTPFMITGGAAPTINATGATNVLGTASINTSGAFNTSINTLTNTGTTTIGNTTAGGAVSINAAAGGVGVNTSSTGNIALATTGSGNISLATATTGNISVAPGGTGNISITGNGTGSVAISQSGATDPNVMIGAVGNNVVIGNTTITGPLGNLANSAHGNLDVRGSMAENVTVVNNATVVAGYTVANTDLAIICYNNANGTVTLPAVGAGLTAGRILTIKEAGFPSGAPVYGQIQINPNGQLLDNNAGGFTMTAGAAHSLQLIYDGTNWFITSYY